MSNIEVRPSGALEATVRVPGSKSITNRALLIAALAAGESTLYFPLDSDDTRFMRAALRELGVDIDDSQPNRYVVYGTGGKFKAASGELFLGNAGTATRFLTALVTLVPGTTVLTGGERMQQRPIAPLLDALGQLGVDAVSMAHTGCPPVAVRSTGLSGGTCRLPGHISSQYLSALLMVAPYADSDATIEIEGALASIPYIDITLDVMAQFGVAAEHSDYRRFKIAAGQRYQPLAYTIEADASSASYFMAMAAVTGGHIRLQDLNPDSKQGDIGFCDLLADMGCRVTKGDNWIEVQGAEQLTAIEVDMNRLPDMVQSLAVVAAYARGKTVIRNVANLRVKETDRLRALATELGRTGIRVEELEDGLVIEGGRPTGTQIQTYDDHRMALAFAVMGLRTPGIRIENPEVVSKSFPTYWETLAAIGIETVISQE